MYNSKVDDYLSEGCGRCKWHGTPQCKVHTWTNELKRLREILNDCGLNEELKWGVPCYTFQGKNILILAAFKEYCSVSFFKGSLLSDTENILHSPGDNSQSTRQFRFTSVKEIASLKDVVKAYVFEAIEIEKSGKKVVMKKMEEYHVPEEFQVRLNKDKALKQAFEALTPGRKKGYLLYFSQPKQSKTREVRIEKYIPFILKGIGMNDR